MIYHTGISGSTCQYRHIENLWGYYEWLDGILLQNGQCYLCTDYTKFANTITSDYTAFGTQQTSPPQNSYITDFMFDEDYSWMMFLPNKGGGSSSTYVPDYCYISTSPTVCAPCVGGGSSSSSGLFYFDGNLTPDSNNNGSRLINPEGTIKNNRSPLPRKLHSKLSIRYMLWQCIPHTV